MLINGYSASGGDALPYFFRANGLGPLIGTRTWGGLIGLSGNPPLMDGGAVQIPTFRIYDPSGRWVVENEGVSPDIEVIDVPAADQYKVQVEQFAAAIRNGTASPIPPEDAIANMTVIDRVFAVAAG
jgi:C-terminal processing protease CtpA/Prc